MLIRNSPPRVLAQEGKAFRLYTPHMKPSRARFTLLRFAFALSVVTYLDRVCIATAATSIREDLHLSAVQMGWIFSAFTLAYAIFEIPSGWLGDTIGPRKVLTRIVLWWSAFTMATGAAWSYVSLLTFRFLFGAGEAGAFPNASRSFSQWFPTAKRTASSSWEAGLAGPWLRRSR